VGNSRLLFPYISCSDLLIQTNWGGCWFFTISHCFPWYSIFLSSPNPFRWKRKEGFYILLSIDLNLFHQGRMGVQFYFVVVQTHLQKKGRLVFPFFFRSKPTPLGVDVIF